jgi:hypothetical protein
VKNDFYITFYDDGDNIWRPNIVPINNNNDTNGIYCYLNETNIFKSSTDESTTFTLHRMKINTVFYFKTKDGMYGTINFPSELIDVPITRFEDFKTRGISKDENFKRYKNVNNDNELIYYGYNLTGFIHDLYSMLFIETKYPWQDMKYDKRINRYLFLIIIFCLNTYKNTKDIITTIIDFINTGTTNITLVDMNNNRHNYDYDENLKLFINSIKKLSTDIKVNTTQEFIGLQKDISDILSKLNNLNLPDVMNNMDPEEVPYLTKYLKEAQHKGISMNQLFKNKYLNYKEKYLALKQLL